MSEPGASGASRSPQPSPARPKIRLGGLFKSFGPKVVLDGVDLDIAAGESMVIIGASGTGKSVLLKHVIGLLKPDAGTVEVDGVAVERLGNRQITEFRRKFGMSFQEGALFDSMTVGQNVGFPLKRLTRRSAAEILARVEECLEMVRLEGVADRMPSQLSGGMRRRVGFARAIAHQPEILLFDEPTTGLDPVTTALIDEVIVDLNDRLKTTTVTITHDMESAFRIGDRIAMLHRGKIIAIAPPQEFRRLEDPRVQQFIHGRAEGPLSDNGGAQKPQAVRGGPAPDGGRQSVLR
jgi:phospholipid/cholesterol/gamma-HCH transport system ATP-binding protein